MDKTDVFQSALSNFVTDAACGGAVRHLVDIGYTLNQIMDRLDYPAPRAKVQRIMMEYLYESRVLLKEEPTGELFAGRTRYVQEQDAYGRRTMRKIESDYNSQYKTTNLPSLTEVSREGKMWKTRDCMWKESVYDLRRDGKLTDLLYRKCGECGEEYSYMSCEFAFLNDDSISQNYQKSRKQRQYDNQLQEIPDCLNNRQREYLTGILWEKPVLYHRLNRRMLEIIGKLYEAGSYGGACYFVAGREKLFIGRRRLGE